MPKTRAEKDTLRSFEKEYKDPKKAKKIYYSKRNKSKKFDRSQGGGFSSKKAKWWAERISKLPASIKANLLVVVNSGGNVDWWTRRIETLRASKPRPVDRMVGEQPNIPRDE